MTDYRSPTYSPSFTAETPARANAVLSALSALQDKIRKLEADCEAYKLQCSTLQQQLQSNKEMEALAERAARTHADTITQERDHIARQYSTAQQQIASLERELASVRESNALHQQQRESQVEREHRKLQDRILSLERAVAEEREIRRATEERKLKAEAMLRDVVQVNEDLVAKSTQRKTTKKTGKVVRKKRPVTASSSSSAQAEVRAGLRLAHDGHSLPFVLGRNVGPSYSTVANVQRYVAATVKDRPVSAPRGRDATPTRSHSAHDRSHSREHERPETHLFDDPRPEDSRESLALIQSLEREFDQLQRQYSSIVAQLQGDFDQKDELHLQAQLRSIIDKLERKGQQLELLKRYQRAVHNRMARLSPATPASEDKRLHALQILHSLRDANRSITSS